jgi:hypothetical protein
MYLPISTYLHPTYHQPYPTYITSLQPTYAHT